MDLDILTTNPSEIDDNSQTTSTTEDVVDAIDKLKPESELHNKVLAKLNDRIGDSEKAMSTFHRRWDASEKKMQIYLNRKADEQENSNINEENGPEKLTAIVIPYAYSTVATICTYLLHTFGGRRPMFPIEAISADGVKQAQMHEKLLQYQIDHVRMLKNLKRYFMDGEIYGLCVMRVDWKDEKRRRTVWKENSLSSGQMTQSTEVVTSYQGNAVTNIDPRLFLPDPSVELGKVSMEGEYCFSRMYTGKHILMKMQKEGILKYVDKVSTDNSYVNEQSGARGSLAQNGDWGRGWQRGKNMYQVDEGTVWLSPKEWGLGESEDYELWEFTILNKKQVVKAQPFTCDHQRHPFVVHEPYGMGYNFGQPSLLDYIGPVQDTMSWLINSHIYNVRGVLNNTFIADPARVEIQDVLDTQDYGGPKVIRLKNTALGGDVRTAIQQLPMQDVTQSHVNDIPTMLRIGDSFSAVNDNLRGQQESGGRKTATEVRQSGEAGASRLAAHARMHSASLSDMTEMMTMNNMQFLTEEFYISVMGSDGVNTPLQIKPQMIVGDFHFPVADGTLPIDKIALLDVWKELFLTVTQDQQLRGQYDITKLFDYIAELGGAKNIQSFKVQMQTQPQIQQGVENGNLTPLNVDADTLMSALGPQMPIAA